MQISVNKIKKSCLCLNSNRPNDLITGFEFNESLFSPFIKVIYYKEYGYD